MHSHPIRVALAIFFSVLIVGLGLAQYCIDHSHVFVLAAARTFRDTGVDSLKMGGTRKGCAPQKKIRLRFRASAPPEEKAKGERQTDTPADVVNVNRSLCLVVDGLFLQYIKRKGAHTSSPLSAPLTQVLLAKTEGVYHISWSNRTEQVGRREAKQKKSRACVDKQICAESRYRHRHRRCEQQPAYRIRASPVDACFAMPPPIISQADAYRQSHCNNNNSNSNSEHGRVDATATGTTIRRRNQKRYGFKALSVLMLVVPPFVLVNALSATEPANCRQLKITFVTGNAMKTREMNRILADHGATKGPTPETSMVDLNVLNVDLPEIQEVDTIAIAKDKVLLATQLANGPCLVEDTSLKFHALGGMPGPYIKVRSLLVVLLLAISLFRFCHICHVSNIL